MQEKKNLTLATIIRGCYLRSDYAAVAAMQVKVATWVRRSEWRLKPVQDIGMKPQGWSARSLRQEKKVALLCSLACAQRQITR